MILRSSLMALCALALAACESTKQASTAAPSGFLMDYEELGAGGEGDFTLAYWDDEADLLEYEKLTIDPVTVWLAESSSLRETPVEEREELANSFHRALSEELGEDFELVETGGPGVLRVRAAITDATESEVFLDTLSTFSWQIRVVSEAAALDQEMAFFVGEAAAEIEVTDGESGARLGAAVDRRLGKRAIGNTLNSWGDAEAAFEAWSRQLRNRLRIRRGQDPVVESN